MSEQPNLDERFKPPMYLMMKAIKMKEFPLLVMPEADQWAFCTQVSALIGGTVVYTTAGDAVQQVLSNIVQRDYLFLIIEESLEGELYRLVRYYLETRDNWGTADAILAQKYQAYPIHSDHRLIQLVDRDVLQQQPEHVRRYLTKLSTVVAVSYALQR